MQKILTLTLLLNIDIALSAELKGDIVRINGVRFFTSTIQGNEIFIPTDELLSESEKIMRSFCRIHLNNEEPIKLRKSEITIQDDSLTKLIRQCSSSSAKENAPRRESQKTIDTYDHRDAKSHKSVIDYLIKK